MLLCSAPLGTCRAKHKPPAVPAIRGAQHIAGARGGRAAACASVVVIDPASPQSFLHAALHRIDTPRGRQACASACRSVAPCAEARVGVRCGPSVEGPRLMGLCPDPLLPLGRGVPSPSCRQHPSTLRPPVTPRTHHTCASCSNLWARTHGSIARRLGWPRSCMRRGLRLRGAGVSAPSVPSSRRYRGHQVQATLNRVAPPRDLRGKRPAPAATRG